MGKITFQTKLLKIFLIIIFVIFSQCALAEPVRGHVGSMDVLDIFFWVVRVYAVFYFWLPISFIIRFFVALIFDPGSIKRRIIATIFTFLSEIGCIFILFSLVDAGTSEATISQICIILAILLFSVSNIVKVVFYWPVLMQDKSKFSFVMIINSILIFFCYYFLPLVAILYMPMLLKQ